MEELLQLTRENNEMLKELLAYVRKIQTPEYQMERQMTSFAINLGANAADRMMECNNQQRENTYPKQTFWR